MHELASQSTKNAFVAIVKEIQMKNQSKRISSIKVDDLYEAMSMLRNSDNNCNNSIMSCIFNKVSTNKEEIGKGLNRFEKDRPQTYLVRKYKKDLFCLCTFKFRALLRDKDLINIIDSGAKALLFGPEYAIICMWRNNQESSQLH